VLLFIIFLFSLISLKTAVNSKESADDTKYSRHYDLKLAIQND